MAEEPPARWAPGPTTDVHCHLLPPELRQPPAPSWEDPWFATCQRAATFASGEDVVRALDQAGLDRALVFGWPFRDPGLLSSVNDYVADEAARSQGRLLGLGLVNPGRSGWQGELSRCADLGLRGLGELNADAQGFELRFEGGLAGLLRRLSEMRWPLILHATEPLGHPYPGKGTARPERLWELLAPALAELPQLQLCLAHLGGGLPFYAHMPEVAALCRQLWFDTAALPYLYRSGVLSALQPLLGPDRLLFGSDFPLLSPGRYQEQVLGLDPTQRDSLYRGAPRAWLGEA
ncbi:MAG: amidohydrolase family protein [Candidatus Dormibacteria bacterium]